MNTTGRFIEKHAVAILIVAASFVLSGILSRDRIEVVTEARKMLPEDNPQVEAFNRINDRFTTAFFLVTIEGDSRERMLEAARELGDRITSDPEIAPLVRSYELGIDQEFLHTWGLMLQKEEDIEKSIRLLESEGLTSFLARFNDSLEDTYSGDEGQEEVDTSWEEINTADFLASIGRAASSMERVVAGDSRAGTEDTAAELVDLFLFGDPYNFDRTGEMLVVGVDPDFSSIDLEQGNALTTGMRRLLDEIGDAYPELDFGYGGDVAQNADEEAAVSNDLFLPSILAFVVILVLFVFSFRRARDVVFALIALGAGIIVTVGYIAVTLGEINLITSSFGVLLIGLGIDFGIHFISNYDEFRLRGLSTGDALGETYRTVGPAIVVAAITTAVSFLALLFTDSLVIRQFGVVAGGGIIITMVSMLTVLPALLVLFPGAGISTRRLPMAGFGWTEPLAEASARHRIVVIAVFLVIVTGAGLIAPSNTFLYDLTKLGPQESPSVVTQRKIEDRMGYSPYPVVYADTDLERIRAITDDLEDERMVAAVSSLSQLIAPSPEQAARLSHITDARESFREEVSKSNTEPPEITHENLEDLSFEIQRLEWNMIEIGDVSVAALGEGNLIHLQRDEMIREIIGAEVGAPGDEVFQRLIGTIENDPDTAIPALNELQRHFVAAIRDRASTLLSPERPIELGDIPPGIRGGLVSDDETTYLVTVVPNTEVTEREGLFRFRDRTEAISPEITGMVPIAIEFSHSIIDEITAATLYIAAALLLILLATFRRFGYTVIISLSLVVSVTVMFGAFPLLGMELNVLSVMVLPLIFGLGIGYFIHVAHRYRLEGAVGPALRYTGKGVILSAATTMIAFGSLGLVGEFRALQLLGQMLFVGMGVVLATVLTLFPAILSFYKPQSKSTQGR